MFSKSLASSLIAGLATVSLAASVAPAVAAPAATKTVTLLRGAVVHGYPGNSAPATGSVAATRPLTGSVTVLPVIGSATSEGTEWVRVLLPQRPDGSTGWISTNATRVGSTPWFIAVSRSAHKARVYNKGRLIKSFTVIVGRPSMPTPAGQFFVAEVASEGSSVTGPYALLTSAYSNVLQEFEGGPGQIALHGRNGLPEPLGTSDSHGCVRFATSDITWLAQHVGAGTPIEIS